MPRITGKILLSALILTMTGNVSLAADETPLLTLSDAVAMALEQNRDLEAVRFDRNAADAAKREAISPLFPQISFTSDVNKSHSDLYEFEQPQMPQDLPPEFSGLFDNFFNFDEIGFSGEQYITKFQVAQLVFDYSVLGNIKLSKLRDQAAEWQETGQEQVVVYTTVSSYLDILRAQELLGVQKQRLKLAKKQLQTAQTNFEVGLRIRTDVLRAELTRSSALRDVVSAEIQLEKAQSALNKVLGIPMETRHRFEGGELAVFNPSKDIVNNFQEYTQLFLLAEEQHPSIKVAELLVKQSEETVNIARGEFYPKVTAGAAWGWHDSGNPDFKDEEWSVRAGIEIPIFEGGRKIAKVRRTKEQLSAETKRYEETVRNIQNLVEQSSLALQEEQRNLEIAIEAEKVAQENYERFSNLYDEGLADSLDLTQSLTELVEAQTNVVTTRYGYLLVFAQLLQALGTIPTNSNAYTAIDWLQSVQ